MITLLHITSALIEFLEMNPVYISTESVTISYMGSRLILEPRDCPSGRPTGIIMPRLFITTETSERNQRLTVDRTPRPDLTKNRKMKSIPVSETSRDECPIFNVGSIQLRDKQEAHEYVKGICRVMSELTQSFLSVVDAESRAITLIINNKKRRRTICLT